MKNPHIIWASVVIILFMVTGTVILAITGHDVSAVKDLAVLIGLPVLGAMGVNAYQNLSGSMEQVKDTSNGRMTEMVNMVKDLHAQVTLLALQVPTEQRAITSTPEEPPQPELPR
jgi:hypothetical protein